MKSGDPSDLFVSGRNLRVSREMGFSGSYSSYKETTDLSLFAYPTSVLKCAILPGS